MQPGFWQTKMSDINHLVLPDSLAISRSSYASEYLALRRTSGFQQMKLRKIIQARPIKSLATSISSHASSILRSEESLASSRLSYARSSKHARLKAWPPANQAKKLSPFQAWSRVLRFSKIMTSSYHSLFVNSGIMRWRNMKQVCQQDVYCLLLNSTCALLFLRMSLQYMQKCMSLQLVSMAPVGAHSALLHIGMPCDSTLLSLATAPTNHLANNFNDANAGTEQQQ